MELKHAGEESRRRCRRCLNRTFYGIETGLFMLEPRVDPVLIVPFMELKLPACP